jgi:hypothetical protein
VYNVGYGKGISFQSLTEIALSMDPNLLVKWNEFDLDDSFYLNTQKLKSIVPMEGEISDVMRNYLTGVMSEVRQ